MKRISNTAYIGGRVPDVTMARVERGAGLAIDGYMYVRCGHLGARRGGTFHNNVPMRCPACTPVPRGSES